MLETAVFVGAGIIAWSIWRVADAVANLSKEVGNLRRMLALAMFEGESTVPHIAEIKRHLEPISRLAGRVDAIMAEQSRTAFWADFIETFRQNLSHIGVKND